MCLRAMCHVLLLRRPLLLLPQLPQSVQDRDHGSRESSTPYTVCIAGCHLANNEVDICAEGERALLPIHDINDQCQGLHQ